MQLTSILKSSILNILDESIRLIILKKILIQTMFPKNLKNTYYGLRHGESEANIISKIVSNPKIGTKQYGLTVKGGIQVKNTIQKSRIQKDIIIYCSDFLRTKQTAKVVSSLLNQQKIHTSIRLRERFFGIFDEKNSSNYNKIWAGDQKDSFQTEHNVESVDNVRKRLTYLIQYLERKYKNKKILLISHGDTLQILYTLFQNKPGSYHRRLITIKTGKMIYYN